MIGDDFSKRTIPEKYPWVNPIGPAIGVAISPPTREEFEALKKEVQELKKLLEAAKKYDESTGQKDCEIDEKVVFIKQIAKLVGVDVSKIFPNTKKKKTKNAARKQSTKR
jgi:hypothetical protein